MRKTPGVLAPGSSRQQLARALNTAYANGLLSEHTLAHRLDLLFGSRLIDPAGLVGDLTPPSAQRRWITTVAGALHRRVRNVIAGSGSHGQILLALDWSGAQDELLVGRHPSCDIVLSRPGVSRRHARLVFRDGTWIVQDLESTNGTFVNHEPVGRRQLRPGDHIVFGDQHVRID